MKINFDLWGRSFVLLIEKTFDQEEHFSIIVDLLENGNNINKKEINLSDIYLCCPHCAERLFVDMDKLDVRINNVLSNKNLIIINMTDACSEERLQQICIRIDIIEIL